MKDEETPPADPLADSFLALANPVRIELLHELREPRTLGDIRLRAVQANRDDLAPGRVMSRQAVRHHLDALLAAGFVRTEERPRGDGVAEHFVLNHRQLFVLAENVRRLARLKPRETDPGLATIPLTGREERAKRAGPSVVLVHGLNEGTAFALDAKEPGARAWVAGRRPDVDIVLDHDPFISGEHTRFLRDSRGQWIVEDVATSRNGTQLNWETLPKGGSAALAPGDVIGLGRTLLVFRT